MDEETRLARAIIRGFYRAKARRDAEVAEEMARRAEQYADTVGTDDARSAAECARQDARGARLLAEQTGE
jgi:hypothetical protein